jgi:hypothetical protein
MGYAPEKELHVSLNVLDLNITYLLTVAPPGQACPLMAWGAYWTLRTMGIPTQRWAQSRDESVKTCGTSTCP